MRIRGSRTEIVGVVLLAGLTSLFGYATELDVHHLIARGFTVVAAAGGVALFLWSLCLWGGLAGRVAGRVFSFRGRGMRPIYCLIPGTAVVATISYCFAAAGIFSRTLAIAVIVAPFLYFTRIAIGSTRRLSATIPSAVVPSLLIALVVVGTPVTFWDCRAYHLAIPEIVNLTGRIPSDEGYVYAYFPLAMESLYGVAMALPVPEATGVLLNAAFMVISALIAARCACSNRFLVAGIVLAIPASVEIAAVPKNTALLAMSSYAAVALLIRIPRGRMNELDRRNLFLAAAATGLSLATHYAALWIAPVIAVLMVRRVKGRMLLRFAITVVCIACPSYVRNIATWGNPVYPAMTNVFGNPAPHGLAPTVVVPSISAVSGLVVKLWTGIMPFGIGSTLGFLIPLGIVLALMRTPREVAERNRAKVAGIGALIGAALLCLTVTQYGFVRFGYGGVLLMAPLAARGLKRIPRPVLVVLLAVHSIFGLVMMGTALNFREALSGGPEQYLERAVRTRPLEIAAARLPSGERIASVGMMFPYGWDARLEASSEYGDPFAGRAVRESETSEAVARRMRDAGYRYVAVDFFTLKRLGNEYGYLKFSRSESVNFEEFLRRLHPIATVPEAGLYRLSEGEVSR